MDRLSEEEKKIVAYLRFYLNDTENEYFDKDFIISKKYLTVILNLIERQKKELDKKDKIINEMGNNIADSSNMYENLVNTEFQHTAEEVIDYFTKKVEGE